MMASRDVTEAEAVGTGTTNGQAKPRVYNVDPAVDRMFPEVPSVSPLLRPRLEAPKPAVSPLLAASAPRLESPLVVKQRGNNDTGTHAAGPSASAMLESEGRLEAEPSTKNLMVPSVMDLEESDIELVMEQTECARAQAVTTLRRCGGDLILAINDLTAAGVATPAPPPWEQLQGASQASTPGPPPAAGQPVSWGKPAAAEPLETFDLPPPPAYDSLLAVAPVVPATAPTAPVAAAAATFTEGAPDAATTRSSSSLEGQLLKLDGNLNEANTQMAPPQLSPASSALAELRAMTRDRTTSGGEAMPECSTEATVAESDVIKTTSLPLVDSCSVDEASDEAAYLAVAEAPASIAADTGDRGDIHPGVDSRSAPPEPAAIAESEDDEYEAELVGGDVETDDEDEEAEEDGGVSHSRVEEEDEECDDEEEVYEDEEGGVGEEGAEEGLAVGVTRLAFGAEPFGLSVISVPQDGILAVSHVADAGQAARLGVMVSLHFLSLHLF